VDNKLRIDIWSDVVCPWCYVGKRRFERALAGFAHRDQVEVVYHAFELDPTKPRGASEPRAEVLRRKYGWSEKEVHDREQHMEKIAAGEGLVFNVADARSGNTADAHQLIHLAKLRGRQEQMVEGLFRAYFTDRRSIFEHGTLVELGAEAGLETEECRQVLAQGTYAAAVAEDERAAHALGATGVPFFVIGGRYGVSGAQPTALFERALTRAWTDARDPAA
jgi:predicted DsbA family dithiol-disulfide isomerase